MTARASSFFTTADAGGHRAGPRRGELGLGAGRNSVRASSPTADRLIRASAHRARSSRRIVCEELLHQPLPEVRRLVAGELTHGERQLHGLGKIAGLQ